MRKKCIDKNEKLGLRLTLAERKLILEDPIHIHDEIADPIRAKPITLAPKKLIRTRRASEGSASEPSLARRVSMCKDAKLSCRGNTGLRCCSPLINWKTWAVTSQPKPTTARTRSSEKGSPPPIHRMTASRLQYGTTRSSSLSTGPQPAAGAALRNGRRFPKGMP